MDKKNIFQNTFYEEPSACRCGGTCEICISSRTNEISQFQNTFYEDLITYR